jgi:hypothetical protein
LESPLKQSRVFGWGERKGKVVGCGVATQGWCCGFGVKRVGFWGFAEVGVNSELVGFFFT